MKSNDAAARDVALARKHGLHGWPDVPAKAVVKSTLSDAVAALASQDDDKFVAGLVALRGRVN